MINSVKDMVSSSPPRVSGLLTSRHIDIHIVSGSINHKDTIGGVLDIRLMQPLALLQGPPLVAEHRF